MRPRNQLNYLSLYLLCMYATSVSLAATAPSRTSPEADARSLLRLSFLAAGGERWRAVRQIETAGTISLAGIQGTFQQTLDVKNGRDSTKLDAGPLHVTQVSLKDSSWQIDQSGIVTYADTPDAKQDAITQSFIDRSGWYEPGAYVVTYIGPKLEDGQTYQLVSVLPAGGRKLTLWFGTKDHLLYRIEQVDASNQKNDLFLSDYRSNKGVVLPYLVRQSNGLASQDTVETVKAVVIATQLDPKLFTPPVSNFQNATLRVQADDAVVPFEIADGRICVQVSLEGHDPLPFLLDSGAGNYLTPEAAKSLGLKGSGSIPLSGTGEAQESGQLTRVNSVRLGPVELKDQEFGVGNLPSFLQDRGGKPAIAGLLGAELLRRFPTTFDYQHQKLTFYRPGTAMNPSSNSTAIPLLFNGGHPFIELQIDGYPGIFGVDTGDSGSITIFRPFYQEHHFPLESPGQNKQQGGIGGKTTALLTRVSSIQLGSSTLEQPLVTLSAASQGLFSIQGIAGNLGYQFLRNFIFTLDYERRLAYIQPSPIFGKAMEYNRSGLSLDRAADGSLLITQVNPDTPAARVGLHTGDKIVRINLADTSTTAREALDDMLAAPSGSRVLIKALRDGRDLDFTLTLEELLPMGGNMLPF